MVYIACNEHAVPQTSLLEDLEVTSDEVGGTKAELSQLQDAIQTISDSNTWRRDQAKERAHRQ